MEQNYTLAAIIVILAFCTPFALIYWAVRKIKKHIAVRKNQKNENKKISQITLPDINLRSEIVATPLKLSDPIVSEHQINFEKRLMSRIENALSRYDFVKKDKIQFLANELIHENLKHSKNILSLEEKRELNLNTRSKYPREFIDCFIGIKDFDFDPKFFCRNLKNTEHSILYCLDEINRLKECGFVNKVTLEGKGLWDNKEYNIDEIPEMEIIDYTEERVMFFIIGKIDSNDIIDTQHP